MAQGGPGGAARAAGLGRGPGPSRKGRASGPRQAKGWLWQQSPEKKFSADPFAPGSGRQEERLGVRMGGGGGVRGLQSGWEAGGGQQPRGGREGGAEPPPPPQVRT